MPEQHLKPASLLGKMKGKSYACPGRANQRRKDLPVPSELPYIAALLLTVAILWTIKQTLIDGKGRPNTSAATRYQLRDDFLSPAERSLFHLLQQASCTDWQVLAKVSLGDLFYVRSDSPSARTAQRNRIDRKHVDFVLCDRNDLVPVLGIELDDASHARPDRRQRDSFVDDVFRMAGLPLMRVTAQRAYDTRELRASIQRAVRSPNEHTASSPVGTTVLARSAPVASIETAPPTCPHCGAPMIRRVAGRGPHAGEAFWGCPNYPRCRAKRPMSARDADAADDK